MEFRCKVDALPSHRKQSTVVGTSHRRVGDATSTRYLDGTDRWPECLGTSFRNFSSETETGAGHPETIISDETREIESRRSKFLKLRFRKGDTYDLIESLRVVTRAEAGAGAGGNCGRMRMFLFPSLPKASRNTSNSCQNCHILSPRHGPLDTIVFALEAISFHGTIMTSQVNHANVYGRLSGSRELALRSNSGHLVDRIFLFLLVNTGLWKGFVILPPTDE